MNVLNINPNELIPYANNPRINDDAVEAVSNSIKEFGFKVPIVVDSNNVVVTGHTRLKSALRLGLEVVPVVVADDLTDEQIKAFRLADNKVGEIADWDIEALGIELQDIGEIDMEMFTFDEEDYNFKEDESEADEDDYQFDEHTDIEVSVKAGDIYKLGEHRLMCGSTTSEADVEKLMDGKEADMIITDPPYNVDYTGATDDTLKIQNDNMSDDEFYNFLFDSFNAMVNYLKQGGAVYCWHSSSQVVNFTNAMIDAGVLIKQQLIWLKQTITLGRQDYQWKHEPCIYGWKEGAPHYWNSDRKQTTVLEFDKPTASKMHPTMKPVALFDYQIKNSSKRGDLVLDGFAGSGTTIMACEQNGRKARTMELDPKYCQVIINRWEEYTGKKAEKVN